MHPPAISVSRRRRAGSQLFIFQTCRFKDCRRQDILLPGDVSPWNKNKKGKKFQRNEMFPNSLAKQNFRFSTRSGLAGNSAVRTIKYKPNP